jgi:hypothetical protein
MRTFYVFPFISHCQRKPVRVNVTAHPTAEWSGGTDAPSIFSSLVAETRPRWDNHPDNDPGVLHA